jgi:hypothetical protein
MKLATELPARWHSLPDIDFLHLLALGRTRGGWEGDDADSIQRFRALICHTSEFHARNPRLPRLIDGGYDLVMTPTKEFVSRCYELVLRRSPTAEELSSWLERKALNPVELSSVLFRLPEFTALYGVSPGPQSTTSSERSSLQFMVNIINQDLYADYADHRCNVENSTLLKLARLKKTKVKVALNLFRLDGDSLGLIENLVNRQNVDSQVEARRVGADEVIHDRTLGGADLFITNNNDLYNAFYDQLNNIHRSEYISACWLWDNHHQFGLSSDVVQFFDLVFPAHSNGQTYLHSSKAIVGSITPCSVFQWTPMQAAQFFAAHSSTERSNNLYGRFNSYKGRCGLRDQFIMKVSERYSPEDLKVIVDNRWAYRSPEDRFVEMLGFKAILCQPIFNDLPARVFDALAVGGIPIVPHGLPDLNGSFTAQERKNLPIITYIPDNLESVGAAIERAISHFDSGGEPASLERHKCATRKHFVEHRVADIINETISLARQ